MKVYRFRNWDRFQHYKKRLPPWIKLHRSLLDDAQFHALEAQAAKYLPLAWLLASENNGVLNFTDEALAFRLRITVDMLRHCIELWSPWIECVNDASESIALCKQVAPLSASASVSVSVSEGVKEGGSKGEDLRRAKMLATIPQGAQRADEYRTLVSEFGDRITTSYQDFMTFWRTYAPGEIETLFEPFMADLRSRPDHEWVSKGSRIIRWSIEDIAKKMGRRYVGSTVRTMEKQEICPGCAAPRLGRESCDNKPCCKDALARHGWVMG